MVSGGQPRRPRRRLLFQVRRRSSFRSVNLRGVLNVTVNWSWDKLIVSLIAAVIGWLSGVVIPAPGMTAVKAPVVQTK